MECNGGPQQPDRSKPGLHIPVRIRMDPPVEVDVPELRPQREEDTPRGAYIKQKRFEEFGYTEDCEGCRRLRSGVVPRRPHFECCRRRVYEELAKTEDGRTWMEKANIKISEHLAEKLEKEIKEEVKTKTTPRDAGEENSGETEEERSRREAESTPAPPDSNDDDITMDEVLGEPITKKRGVADHFGDFGEEMRKQGEKI